jgi:hypothetical protein
VAALMPHQAAERGVRAGVLASNGPSNLAARAS